MRNREIERMAKRMYESGGDDRLILTLAGKDVTKIARALDADFRDTVRLLVTSASEARVAPEGQREGNR